MVSTLLILLSFTSQSLDGAKYSPLDTIDRSNVSKLHPAWTFHTQDTYTGSRGGLRGKASAFECTPVYADGVLYVTTAFGRVIALDPDTGAQKWAYDPHLDTQVGYGDFANRGVATWRDPHTRKRTIFIATIDAQLIALDSATGLPLPTFANDGKIDLKKGLRLPVKSASEYEETSPPAVIGDVIVVGSGIADNGRTDMPSGEVRAFDLRTGKLLWTFDPMPGTRTGAANAWSLITPDPAHDMVFVPTGSPSPDYYGGERKGNDQYANSVVALNAKTGKVIWSFQTVHHDLWDYDVASPPALITAKGKPAVAVGSKTGNLFILDRLTGKPVFGVEERPVPKSDIPGEESSPTQPFPVLPKHLGPTTTEVWGPTEEEKKFCTEAISKMRYDGIFTPPSLNGSLLFPGNIGGMAWGGAAFDPKSATLFVPYNRLAAVARLVPRDSLKKAIEEHPDWEVGRQEGTPYAMQRNFLLSPKGTPCTPPPYGLLAAIDANTGQLKWETPVGFIPWAPAHPEWGSPSLGGAIVTAGGLLFMGATFDPYLKAYDTSTGKELWRAKLPASARATPMTFRSPKGKQYVVIAAGGHDVPGAVFSDALVAFTLP
ncbi:MAG: pyrroloquinoline quinone-dependent dehydrogenase [Acidobacteriota bacterium]|nr:pyrroloquinoline quinone-dependent dehydrogenase [Acidobacteriota bacterium]